MEYQTYGDQVKSIGTRGGTRLIETRNGQSFSKDMSSIPRVDGPWEHQYDCTLQDVYYHFGRFQDISNYIHTGCDGIQHVPLNRNNFYRGYGPQNNLLTGYYILLLARGYDYIYNNYGVYPTVKSHHEAGIGPVLKYGYSNKDLWMDFRRCLYTDESEDLPTYFILKPIKCLTIFPGIQFEVDRSSWDGKIFGSQLFDLVFNLRTPGWIYNVQPYSGI